MRKTFKLFFVACICCVFAGCVSFVRQSGPVSQKELDTNEEYPFKAWALSGNESVDIETGSSLNERVLEVYAGSTIRFFVKGDPLFKHGGDFDELDYVDVKDPSGILSDVHYAKEKISDKESSGYGAFIVRFKTKGTAANGAEARLLIRMFATKAIPIIGSLTYEFIIPLRIVIKERPKAVTEQPKVVEKKEVAMEKGQLLYDFKVTGVDHTDPARDFSTGTIMSLGTSKVSWQFQNLNAARKDFNGIFSLADKRFASFVLLNSRYDWENTLSQGKITGSFDIFVRQLPEKLVEEVIGTGIPFHYEVQDKTTGIWYTTDFVIPYADPTDVMSHVVKAIGATNLDSSLGMIDGTTVYVDLQFEAETQDDDFTQISYSIQKANSTVVEEGSFSLNARGATHGTLSGGWGSSKLFSSNNLPSFVYKAADAPYRIVVYHYNGSEGSNLGVDTLPIETL